MASEWEMAMGVELGMGLGGYYNASNATGGAGTPMSHHAGNYSAAAHHFYGMEPVGDADMRVDELLDLSLAGAHDFFPAAADNGSHHLCAVPGEPSAATPSATSSDHQTSMLSFADEFYIPREEAAELEWLSKFVDDSYSDMPNYSSAAHAAMAAAANNGSGSSAGQHSCVTTTVPGRGARSKRSRASAAAAAAWHSLMPHPPSQGPSPSSSCSSSDFPSSTAARPNNVGSRGRKQGPSSVIGGEVGLGLVEGGVRRCTHCASEKTPQWRTGPLGPKTLCNACGVRFKSGRLVPEYRPAASPTFLLTQHSNSHRKVMELRRQKEFVPIRGSHRVDAGGAVAAGAGAAVTVKQELMFRDYGIC